MPLAKGSINDDKGKTSLAQFSKLLNKYYSQSSVVNHIVENGKSLAPEKAAVLDREIATRVMQSVFSHNIDVFACQVRP